MTKKEKEELKESMSSKEGEIFQRMFIKNAGIQVYNFN